MSKSYEPSYYEIALTNRQVLVAFILLLGCVAVAFFSGVWVGRQGTSVGTAEAAERIDAGSAGEGAAAQADSELPEFKFFSEEEQPPAPPEEDGGRNRLSAEPGPGTTLAQDVGSPDAGSSASPGASRDAAPPREPSRQAAAPEPSPAREEPSPPATRPAEPAPAVQTPAAAPGLVIQVLSSRDAAKAREVLERLLGGGYRATLSSVEDDGVVMHRVRIGPYKDREAAEAAAERVRRTYKLDTWITTGG